MVKKKRVKSKKERSNKKDDKILFAFLATFLSIIGFVIALIAKRNDVYVMYYAKQSLVIFIIGAIAGILKSVFILIPIIGIIINVALGIIVFIIWLLSWIYALSGEKKSIPIVSDWTKKINL